MKYSQKKKIKSDSKGVTLIALAITIIILLILSGITINALFGDNGLISAAKKAKDDTKQDEINTEQGIDNLINGMNKVLGIKSYQIASEPEKYYGRKVNYVAGNENFQNELEVSWKIFYADNEHIYLIASDYVPVDKLPNSTDINGNSTINKPVNTNSGYPKAAPYGSSNTAGVMPDYIGSARISDSVKYLNKSYFDYLATSNTTSTNDNMKAQAYALDTNAWKTYKDSAGKADFVIGGPTIEMLFNSYCQKYKLNEGGKNKYQARVTHINGYQISTDFGVTWKNVMDSSEEYLNEEDQLYVITSQSGAVAYWVSSPCAEGSEFVFNVSFDGNVHTKRYRADSRGFRPIIALRSNVALEEQEDETFNIK